ncbi:hypothetical protein J2754_001494 [Halarchaeum solikamskense]|uniref:hypothetical protein n=1 Tax=Halarchaeum nitratireducens TaxID=489913 RepID=UPI001B3A91D6|nr:hypothetical protein [Halarchaeum solikamskense]MBP2251173.1 hypothetical protein [Halarchaeum solikamskense]
MRAALVDAIVAVREAREALGRVRLADVTTRQRELTVEEREHLGTLTDHLTSTLTDDEWERLEALEDDVEADADE